MTGSLFVGLDLGWTTGATGVATVDAAGRLQTSGRVRTDAEIEAWIRSQQGQVTVVAVDAPLVVPNETGMRQPERMIGQAFGGFGASAHTSNRAKFGGQPPRALQLAERFGWAVDPAHEASPAHPLCIEVYPHPALVGLFELGYRLDYKKGNSARRSPGFLHFMDLLESVQELDLRNSARWAELRSTVAAPGLGDLTRVEDELDAILCAHLAWLWHHRRDTLHVYGSLEDGYIVAPPAPSHRPLRPLAATDPRTAKAAARAERRVTGRPTGFAGGDNEQRWKAAVRDAFAGVVMPQDRRVQLVVDFALGPDQRDRNEPDLDNLIKSTVDALVGVLGRRPGTGTRVEADDVRVDRITASKRRAHEGEPPGATIRISALAQEAAG